MRVLVAGGLGTLGSELGRVLGEGAVLLEPPDLDVTDSAQVRSVVCALEPDAIVNCAAVTDVDLCQRDPDLAMRVHRDGVGNLLDTGVRTITLSSDHVFSGVEGDPLLESSPTDPVNEYGRSKLAGEELAIAAGATVVRTSWLFGGGRGLVPFLCRGLAGGRVRAVRDQTCCATWAGDLAPAIAGLLERDVSGVVHMANTGACTPVEIAGMLRPFCGGGTVEEISWRDLGLEAPRPSWSALGSERGFMLRPLAAALDEWRDRNEIG